MTDALLLSVARLNLAPLQLLVVQTGSPLLSYCMWRCWLLRIEIVAVGLSSPECAVSSGCRPCRSGSRWPSAGDRALAGRSCRGCCPPGGRRPGGGRDARHDDHRHPYPPKRTEDAPGGLLPVASGSANALRDDAPPSTGAPEADGPAAAVREDDPPPPTALAQRRSAACRAAPVMTEEVVMGRRGCGGQARGSKTTRGRRNIGWRRTMPPKDVAVVLVTVTATS